MSVFGVVAMAGGLLGIGILVASLKVTLGSVGGIMVWNIHDVMQVGKDRS